MSPTIVAERRRRAEALRAVRTRSLANTFLYPAVMAASWAMTPLAKRFPLGTAALAAAVTLAALLQGLSIWKNREKLFIAARLGLALTLGALACLSITGFELGWTSFFVLLLTLAVASAEVPITAPTFWLSASVISLVLGPSFAASWVLISGLKGWALSAFFSLFYGLLLYQAKVQSEQYFAALKANARLRAMIDAVPGTVSWVNSELRYVGVNQAMADLWKRDPDSFEGQPVGFADSRTEMAELARQLFLSPDSSFAKEVRRRTPEEERYYYLSGHRYNQEAEAVILGIDITDYKKRVQALEGARIQSRYSARLASLGEVVAHLADELDSPLPSMNREVAELKSWMQLGDADLERAMEVLEDIDRVFYRISRLANLLGRFSNDRDDEVSARLAIDELASNLSVLCSQRLARQGVRFEVENLSGEDYIEAHATRLLEAVLNLVNNAYDAVRELPERWVRVEFAKSAGSQTVISVTDSGSGIPEALRARLFEPLFTTKAPGKGTGVGLSTAREIARQQGGDLKYDSSSAHTRFVITLPKAKSAA